MPATFRTAALAVHAQVALKNRFANKVEDPSNPYSNHSESESDSEDEEIKEIPVTAAEAAIKKEKKSKLRRYRGMLLALLSSLIFSLTALLVKKLEGYHPISIALWRFQGALLPAVPLIIHKLYFSKLGNKVFDRVWPWSNLKNLGMFGLVLLRSVLSCNSLLLHFYSLQYMSIGDALTIASSTPIFVALLAKVFLKEKCGLVTIIASLFTLVGVAVITRPPMLTGEESFDMKTLIGSALALGCMLLASISFTVLRYIRKVHYSITTLMFGLWGTVENIVLAFALHVFKSPSGLKEWGLIGTLALLTFIGQCAIILAMKAEQAGPVAVVRTFDVIFGVIWQIIILHSFPDKISVIGASIVVLAVGVCGFRKWLRGLPVGHPTRARFRYFMM
ncbi:unnamed protein product [Orchesella dallaii]|uniref:EamA domain-containing protein n=1 Tax=Orchesella dallaii TaxID=48710 RepID=A0ABP1QQQ9_9HEXA